jgi:hypothetical protein
VDDAHPAATATHAPLQSANSLPQTKVHAPATHAAWALSLLVVQAWPHAEQLLALLVVSTQLPEHTVGAVDGQLAVQA